MRSEVGAERRKTAATATAAAPDTRRKRVREDPPVTNRNDGAGGNYRVGGKGQEKSADKSVKWSGEDTEGLVPEEEADTARGAGEVGQALTSTAWELEGSGVEEIPGGAAAVRGDTWEVTSEDVDAEGVGGCHGAKERGRERVAGVESSGVGIREGGG